MAVTTKKLLSKKPPAKRPPTNKTVVRKNPAHKTIPAAANKAKSSRRQLVSRTQEYTGLTWALVAVWLILIAIFVGTVLGRSG